MMDFRNQLVHAWLSNRLQRKVHVKYLDAGSIKKEHISHERFAGILRQFIGAGYDNALGELIERFKTQPHRYWKATDQIRNSSNDAKLRQIVYSGLDGNPPLRPGDYSLTIDI